MCLIQMQAEPTMLTVAQARSKFIQSVVCNAETETIALDAALLRISAADIRSNIDVPPTDNSAMDGFAVNSREITEIPVELSISQRIPAGAAPKPLAAGSVARIFTGGQMPVNSDSVVIQENCEYGSSAMEAGSVKILQATQAGDNVRPRGQDITIGETVVRAGAKLSAVDLGLLASIGQSRVTVFKKIKVAIFSTGNELAEPGKVLKPGQIYNSNRTMLMAICRQLGYEVFDCGIIEDTLAATKNALSESAAHADVIISSGGVSVGEEDHIKPAVEALGDLQHWKVKMKPGKPVVLGKVNGTPFLGLPGNPVSSYVVFLLLGIPLLRSLQGQGEINNISYQVSAGFDKPATSREEYIRVRIVQDSCGVQTVESFKNLSSGVLTSLSWADGLVRQTVGQTIKVGEPVEFLPIREGLL